MDSSDQHNLTVRAANRKAFGARLRRAIADAGMTIDSFAVDIGMSLSGVRKWLYGDAEPGMEALVKAANSLKVSISWLATGQTGDDAPQPEASNAGRSIDAELMGRVTDKILRTYKELSIPIPPVDVGRLAAKWYGLISHIGDDPAERAGALAVLAAQLKADLSTPISDDATSKRRA